MTCQNMFWSWIRTYHLELREASYGIVSSSLKQVLKDLGSNFGHVRQLLTHCMTWEQPLSLLGASLSPSVKWVILRAQPSRFWNPMAQFCKRILYYKMLLQGKQIIFRDTCHLWWKVQLKYRISVSVALGIQVTSPNTISNNSIMLLVFLFTC